jgi:hypothetical protein
MVRLVLPKIFIRVVGTVALAEPSTVAAAVVDVAQAERGDGCPISAVLEVGAEEVGCLRLRVAVVGDGGAGHGAPRGEDAGVAGLLEARLDEIGAADVDRGADHPDHRDERRGHDGKRVAALVAPKARQKAVAAGNFPPGVSTHVRSLNWSGRRSARGN